jgi:uncharacterized protein
MQNVLCGIDFGSKLAGTTVLCTWEASAGTLALYSSRKNQDADRFIIERIDKLQPGAVFLDAPQSLPGVYTRPGQYSDYFYRAADRQLRAMSPMFLGGLTARAMQLKAGLSTAGIPVYETYPAQQARRLGLTDLGYKKTAAGIPAVCAMIRAEYSFLPIRESDFRTWHQVDALLALLAAIRFEQGVHEVYGDEGEGIIVV